MLELPRQHVVLMKTLPSLLSLSLCLYRYITIIVLPVWNILIQQVLNALLLQMAQGHSNCNGDHLGPSSM